MSHNNPQAATAARVVSGKTKAKRGQLHPPHVYAPRVATPAARVVSGKTKAARKTTPVAKDPITGARVVSGKTKALRSTVLPGNVAAIPGTGATGNTFEQSGTAGSDGGEVATGGKSGATVYARNQQAMIDQIKWVVIWGVIIIGGIYVIRRYKLLQGG